MKNIRHIIALSCTLLLVSCIQAQSASSKSVANPALRRELLQRVERQDQAIRNHLSQKGIKHSDQSIFARLQAIDKSNIERMRVIVRRYGWPGLRLVGRDGTEAASLLVRQADLAFQKQMLPLVEKAYKRGELSGHSYALLLDRVLAGEGKKQVYGTQTKLQGKEIVPDPIEDEANVDKRRTEVGLPPLSEYLKEMNEVFLQDKDKQ